MQTWHNRASHYNIQGSREKFKRASTEGKWCVNLKVSLNGMTHKKIKEMEK